MKKTKHSRYSLLCALNQLDNSVMCIAMDLDGRWFGYREKPFRLDNAQQWRSDCEHVKIPGQTIEVSYPGGMGCEPSYYRRS